MSQVPWLICVVVLALLLVIRELQNSRIQKGLIDKILVSKGSDELPLSPLDKVLEGLAEDRKEHPNDRKLAEIEKKIERQRKAVHFNIPGMPEFKGK